MSDVFYDITDDVKRDVLAATDLVALIGAVTGLKKAGRSWKGLCPFHGEKTPSFHVHPEKGFYYCFGCGAKGDAITFVRETERLEFAEAVAYLARRAGVALPVRRSGTRVDRAKETRVAEALAAAAAFFREVLPRHAASVALLSKRGLAVEEAASFGIGAAPEGWDALKSSLTPRIPEETLIEAGLLQRHPDTGRVYDRFRNRLTFEIRDGRGEVLGFGARALGDDPPKYLNTPETNRFTKGKLLYGLDRAKEAIRKEETVLLVEGYFDRIAFARAGRENAVASMGTALTPAQADLLARHAATVIVAYDGDAAGLAASYKAFPLLLSRGAAVKHLAFPGGHDPDSFLLENGAEALQKAVDAAPALIPALLSRISGAGSDPDARAARLNEAVEIVSQARDTVLRHELLSALSRGTGVPMAVLAARQTAGPAASPAQPPAADPFHGIPGMERKALCILLLEGDLGADLVRLVPDEIFSHPVANEIFKTLKTRSEKGLTLDFSEVQPHLEAVAGQVAARLFLEGPEPASANQQREDERGLARLHKPLLLLKIRQFTLRLEGLTREVAEAAANGDVARRDALQIEKSRVSAERRRLESESRQT
jgi:DNA primase